MVPTNYFFNYQIKRVINIREIIFFEYLRNTNKIIYFEISLYNKVK